MLLEARFEPLGVVAAALPLLAELRDGADARLRGACCARRLLVLLLVRQLSRCTKRCAARFQQLLAGLSISDAEVEQIVVVAVRARPCARASHQEGCVHFGGGHRAPSAAAARSSPRSRASSRSSATRCRRPRPPRPRPPARRRARRPARSGALWLAPRARRAARPRAPRARARRARGGAFLTRVRRAHAAEHAAALTRKLEIERRKEQQERAQSEKKKAEEEAKAAAEKQRRKEEVTRLATEARAREREKLQKMRDEMVIQETKELLEQSGKTATNVNVEEMSSADRVKLLEETKAAAIKAKEDEVTTMKERAHRLDYVTRATRMEELPELASGAAARGRGEEHAVAWEGLSPRTAPSGEHGVGAQGDREDEERDARVRAA